MATTDGTVAKIKQEINGRIQFLNASDVPLLYLSPLAEIRRNGTRDGFLIRDNASGKGIQVFVSKLTHYIIDPAPQVAFVGTMWDWWRLLVSTLNFIPVRYPFAAASEIINTSSVPGASVSAALNWLYTGGGGALLVVPFSGVYAPIDVNQSLYATATATLNLPAGVIGRYYEVGANNNNVDIVPNGSELIIGEPLIKLKKYDSVILRYVAPNNWLIF